MSRRQFFLLYYYSHLPLIIMAMVLSGTINATLYQRLNFHVILLVGLATFLTYSIDNLIDWHKDASHYASITQIIRIYHKLTLILMPLASLGILYLICQSSNELQIGILFLGAAAVMGTTRLPINHENSDNTKESVSRFILNRFFISTIWTTVCVFLPIWYISGMITPRILTIFLYLFCLVFIYAVLWKFEKSSYSLKRKLLSSPLFKTLSGLAGTAMLLVIFDIVTGLASIFNLVNILPPLISLIYIRRIAQKPVFLRRAISQFTVILALLCTLSTVIMIFAV